MKNLIRITIFAISAMFSVFTVSFGSSTENVDMSKCVHGIDVSHYQGTVDWPSVKTAGINFTFIKATDGASYQDPMFSTNWQGSKSAGITRGAYHFYRPDDNVTSQADNFINTVSKLDIMDLPPVIDIEIQPPSGISNEQFCQGILTWLQTVEKALDHKPIIYTYYSFAQSYLTDENLNSYPLWLADYQNPPASPLLPNTWANNGWKFWQYSQSGTCSGINGNVDLDVYNGSGFDLNTFILEQTISGSL